MYHSILVLVDMHHNHVLSEIISRLHGDGYNYEKFDVNIGKFQ